MTRFDSLLIANRGEIVARVARTARDMGLRSVAVFSHADRDAPHRLACDLAVPIGGERPADSYLRIDKLLAAAQASGAQAVHPGYGFLAENAAFAQAVRDAGLVWVGPPPSAMTAMGDKASARQRMASAGVPVLPGYDGEAQDLATLHAQAVRVGFPLMIKATAGGGGRGMRLVTGEPELDAALASAMSEAQTAFGNGRVLLERALTAPRHVEIQVFADGHGKVLHLGERDCSVQRRHQKIVEEAPSPAVSPALRRAMGAAAVQVAREIGYVGAGTVEFLLDASEGGASGDARFWFMEMNTRLQVEHPVTEALTGVDLVEWQLRVAAGEPLPLAQDEVLRRFEAGGHAIEVRLCAEDPGQGYLPQAGRLRRWQAPHGVRCDHALASGMEIAPFYDSMLAKLIAHDTTRDAAAQRLAAALDRTQCLGLPTNRAFLARVLRHPAFASGPVTTAFLGEHFPTDVSRQAGAPSGLHALAAACIALLPRAPLPPLWAGWTCAGVVQTEVPMEVGGVAQAWQLNGSPGNFEVRWGAAQHRIEGLQLDAADSASATLDGRPVKALRIVDGTSLWLQADGYEIAVQDCRHSPPPASANASAEALVSPMHGRVVQVPVAAGQAVRAGELLVVLEAMKMEHRVVALHDGTVAAVHARVGDQVAARKLLVEVARS